jgi:hypothetical protein
MFPSGPITELHIYIYIYIYVYTVKPLFNESQGIGFSCTKSRFSQNGGYAKLHQKLFFFAHILTVLYDFFSLVILK